MAENLNNNILASVLMPVFNSEKYLTEAIESILNQTYSDFYFYIINDGSKDSSEEIVKSYLYDNRIVYLKNEENKGIVFTLNRGLELIKTKYILRMDADDISLPNRFEKQILFMEEHPSIGVCGCQIELFGSKLGKSSFELEDSYIKAALIFDSNLAHPSVIIRNNILKENNIKYMYNFPHMEDYHLWFILKDFTKFANINEVLLKYRISNQNITVINANSVIERKKVLFKNLLVNLDINATEEELSLQVGFAYKNIFPTKRNIYNYKEWLDKIIISNKKSFFLPHKELIDIIKHKWNWLFYILPDYSIRSVVHYIKINKTIKKYQLVYLLKFYLNKILKFFSLNNKNE